MSTIQEFEAAAAKATQASSQAYTWAKGPINTSVPTDSGLVPTIAEFTRANQVRADNAINAIGWVLAGDFTAGCTVTGRNQYVLEVGGSAYKWDGSLPKTVPPGSAPSPEAAGSWVRILFTSDTPPLPDVWAPLSDSLRLITGYGRDVLVGSDVVARMVNFSRSTTATYIGKDGKLKAAAINEPRFEKEGLLIEGQSTNLIADSNNHWLTGGQAIAGTVVDPAGTVKNIYTATKVGGTFINLARVEVSPGTKYTASAWVYCHDERTLNNKAMAVQDNKGSIFASIAPVEVAKLVVGKFVRVSLSFTPPQGSTSVTIVGFVDPPIGAGGSLSMCQFEAIPFASSYIPTAGAAVTCSADVATLPQSLNLGESQLGFSLAVEFDTVNTGPHRILELSDFSSIIADGASLTIRHAGKEVYGINAPLGQRHHIAYSVAADGVITVALNGKVLAPQSRSGGAASSKASIILGNRWSGANDMAMYGHLRDLKIWTKTPLTVEQLKVASA